MKGGRPMWTLYLKQIFRNRNSSLESKATCTTFIRKIIIIREINCFQLKEEIHYRNPPGATLGGRFLPFYIAVTIILVTWLLIANLTHGGAEKVQPVTIYKPGAQTDVPKGRSIVEISGEAKTKMWLKSVRYRTSCPPSFKSVVQLTGLTSMMNFVSPN